MSLPSTYTTPETKAQLITGVGLTLMAYAVAPQVGINRTVASVAIALRVSGYVLLFPLFEAVIDKASSKGNINELGKMTLQAVAMSFSAIAATKAAQLMLNKTKHTASFSEVFGIASLAYTVIGNMVFPIVLAQLKK